VLSTLCRPSCIPGGLLAAVVALLVGQLAWAADDARAPWRFTLVDGDRVVLLGSALVERDASHGYLEAALTARFHPARIQFRNLGRSGDTVLGDAHAGFGTAADGFDHLKRHVLALRPTVILLGYGANESFAGREGLQSFLDGLNALLSALDDSKARIVFLSPLRHEDLGRPLPDPAQHNQQLKLYSDAIAKVAAQRGAPLVNLFELLGEKLEPALPIPLTDDGLHLTAYGYWRAAPMIEQALGLAHERWEIEVDVATRNIGARGATIRDAQWSQATISFQALDRQLPATPPPQGSPPEASLAAPPRVLRVFGLPRGRYALKIDGQPQCVAAATAWARGVTLSTGPDFAQAEAMREAIRGKNELYFHRWRPQNEPYLFGFRKHEQGNNAVEIPQFDPLVEAKEAEIQRLAAPVALRYELVQVEAP
jgi:lysophospholipase L1-like esterase